MSIYFKYADDTDGILQSEEQMLFFLSENKNFYMEIRQNKFNCQLWLQHLKLKMILFNYFRNW